MKKNQKGMTLVEVIVALALFAIMSLVVATIFSNTAQINKMTNAMNNKIDVQIALANFYGEDSTTVIDDTTYSITFDFGGLSSSVEVPIETRELTNGKYNNNPESKVSTNIKYFVKRS